jgi:hypothetical protein
MNNLPQQYRPEFGDISLPLTLRGTTTKWIAGRGWHDQDGLPVPKRLAVIHAPFRLWDGRVQQINSSATKCGTRPDPGDANQLQFRQMTREAHHAPHQCCDMTPADLAPLGSQ